MNTVIGTPQARWRDSTQSGLLTIMPVMRFCPCGGTQRVTLMAASARARSVSPGLAASSASSNILVHRDEPLRRVAEDHRLFRAPRMRILVLEPGAGDQHAGIDQGLDDRLVGVALLALVGEHALAGKSRRLLGQAAIGIHRVGDGGGDAARRELGRVRGPDLEVVAAVARGGMYEAGSGIVADMVAGEQRHRKIVVAAKPFERMRATERRQIVG